MSDAKFLKKRITTGDIEADIENQTINVHCEIEAIVMGEDEIPISIERKNDVKKFDHAVNWLTFFRIKVAGLNENTNVPALARQIIDKCKLIHISKLPVIESMLYLLKDKKLQEDRSVVYNAKKSQG